MLFTYGSGAIVKCQNGIHDWLIRWLPSLLLSRTAKRRVQRTFAVGTQVSSWLLSRLTVFSKVSLWAEEVHMYRFLFFSGGRLSVRSRRYQTSMTYLAMFQSFSIDKQRFYWTAKKWYCIRSNFWMTKFMKTIRWPLLQKDIFKNWWKSFKRCIMCANYELLF